MFDKSSQISHILKLKLVKNIEFILSLSSRSLKETFTFHVQQNLQLRHRKWKKIKNKVITWKTSWNLMQYYYWRYKNTEKKYTSLIKSIQNPKKNLPCCRIGHDLTILISCAFASMVFLLFAGCLRLKSRHDDLNLILMPFRISCSVFFLLLIHEKLMWRLHSTKMYLIKNLFFFLCKILGHRRVVFELI